MCSPYRYSTYPYVCVFGMCVLRVRVTASGVLSRVSSVCMPGMYVCVCGHVVRAGQCVCVQGGDVCLVCVRGLCKRVSYVLCIMLCVRLLHPLLLRSPPFPFNKTSQWLT